MDLKRDGFVITSAHEPFSFIRRSGRENIHTYANYIKLHTEETVLELKSMGLSLLRFHYHKGFGYETEKEDRELTREFCKLCHKHGLNVQLYVQFGTLMPETYRAEEPDYDDWIQRDEAGKPISLLYSHQNFRNHPCMNQPGYWEHLKKILREAIIDCSADAIGFDNVSHGEEPDVCKCEACRKAFTEFIKSRYPDKASAKARFGHEHTDHIEPPVWNYFNTQFNLTEIRQPVLQEWMEFRALSLKNRVDEMYKVCKDLNPDVFIEINAFRQTGQNSTFITGLYVSDLSTGCDGYWSEMEPNPGYNAGLLHHKIRAYKCVRALDKLLFTGHVGGGMGNEPEPLRKHLLAVSESMVFQYGCVNGVGLIRNYSTLKNYDPPYMPLLRFSQEHREIYAADPMPFVHVYESRASLSNSNFESHYANILMQQVLLREKIPYAILHDLDNIDECRAVVLPGAMCLSDAEVKRLVDFVNNGGGLILTGNTGDFNEHYMGREDQSLKSLLGIAQFTTGDFKPLGDALWEDRVNMGGLHLANAGKGKVASFPRLTSDNDFETYELTHRAFAQSQIFVEHKSWEAPDDMHRIGNAVRWVLNNDLPVVVNAPESVVIELTGAGNVRYLHILNYDTSVPAKAITVSFKDKISSVHLFIPHTGEEKTLNLLPGEPTGRSSVIINEVEVYAVVRFTVD